MFYAIDYSLMRKYVLHAVNRYVYAMKQAQIFSERQPLHLINWHTSAKVCHALINVKYRRAGDYKL